MHQRNPSNNSDIEDSHRPFMCSCIILMQSRWSQVMPRSHSSTADCVCLQMRS